MLKLVQGDYNPLGVLWKWWFVCSSSKYDKVKEFAYISLGSTKYPLMLYN